MKIHEYQAKQLLARGGISCPAGTVVETGQDPASALADIKDGIWVVKAQVHAGGRGKGTVYKGGKPVGRGIQIAKSAAQAAEFADNIMGGSLVTIQTGSRGRTINRVLVESSVDIRKEYYLAIIVDRERHGIVIMASTEGGTEIEEVARTNPEKIHTARVNPLGGFKEYHGRNLGLKLGLDENQIPGFVRLLGNLYKLFVASDCSLAEINPLVLTGDGQFMALDAKVTFDDNAIFRQPEIAAMQDISEEEPSEVEAARANLTYIKLDGNIGCLVNGAGLAMATMDMIKEVGGEPANFLDVGGTATADNVARSFRIMLKDRVDGIFVNVFGGIVRCDVVAAGLVEALGAVNLSIPLVVRLEGNRKEEAIKILQESGLPLVLAADMRDGAVKIVEACGKSPAKDV